MEQYEERRRQAMAMREAERLARRQAKDYDLGLSVEQLRAQAAAERRGYRFVGLNIGVTHAAARRAVQEGRYVHLVINAKHGEQWRNRDEGDALEMVRDASLVRRHQECRLVIRQFCSRWFRRRLRHLVWSGE